MEMVEGNFILNIKQAAEHAGVTSKTIRNWIKRGMPVKIESRGLGIKYKVDPSLMDAWVKENSLRQEG